MPVFLSQNPLLRKLYRYTKNGMVSLFKQNIDEATREQLGALLSQSRERELMTLPEQREPHFHSPALDSDEVRRCISGMLQLDAEIQQKEPNALVRRLYHDAIEEELNFLRII